MSETSASPGDRRAEIVRAAMRAFARGGYGGTTLADIAAEAGVTQPRISQIFGNKENAFIEAHRMAAGRLVGVLNENASPPFSAEVLGAGYYELARQESEALLIVFQGFASAYVPAIGDESRRTLAEVLDIIVNRAGGTYADAADFLGTGFTIHHVMAVNLPDHARDSEHFSNLLRALRPAPV
ncbi:TetR family transcriptional regulator [Naumannella sp. ID2617S]|nr:TetR family transcriptional regulator [Naumannella sp. ID2617S]